MRELVDYIVGELTGGKDYTVEALPGAHGDTEIRITLPQPDMGKVIGRGGRIAKAIRTVVKAVSTANGGRYSVEICEKQA